jgi:hypothetical protein
MDVEGKAGTFPAELVPKSNAVPGVFGVLVALEKPNAPDPKPNALDAPDCLMDGEDIPVVLRGGISLKGLDRPPWELVDS